MINDLIAKCPKHVDLTNSLHSKIIVDTVETLLESGISISEIEEIERGLISRNDSSLVFVLLILKIVKSKIIVSGINKPLVVSVIFAVYKEHNRIKTNREHPHGEDFLLKKVEQLEWLFNNKLNIRWELIIVDDGCPENSGAVAENIINKNKLNDKVRVLYLKDAIENNLAPAKSISTTNDSQKGGSIIYGMWDAVQVNKSDNHIVVYTDADLSTHLGQLGLLINPLLNKNKLVAIGSRREPDSIVIKKGSRNNRGKLFIYLWKRLIPNLGNIIDTQCGFKAFNSEMLVKIIDNLIEKKFAFDIELLLRAELLENDTIMKVPIAWIDSEEASTTTDLQPYLPMLRAIAKMSRKYFKANNKATEFATFIDAISEKEFNKILENIPDEISKREPIEFTEFDEVKVTDFIFENK